MKNELVNLAPMNNLTRLDLHSNLLDNRIVHVICLADSFTSLTSLNVDYNQHITGVGLLEIITQKPRLLDLSCLIVVDDCVPAMDALFRNTTLMNLSHMFCPSNLPQSTFTMWMTKLDDHFESNKRKCQKRQRDLLWILYILKRDAKDYTSTSTFRRMPLDMRNLIMEQLCFMWADTLHIGRTKDQILYCAKNIQIKT
jgi:hypothetical protein